MKVSLTFIDDLIALTNKKKTLLDIWKDFK